MSDNFMEERKTRSFGTPPVEGTSAVEPVEEGDVTPEAEVAPAPTLSKSGKVIRAFSVMPVSDNGLSFAAEWLPSMETPTYIGETKMLLQYLQFLERIHSVTMPIKACGIDPIVFENVECPFKGPDDGAKLFPIEPEDRAVLGGHDEEDEEEMAADSEEESSGSEEAVQEVESAPTASEDSNSREEPAPLYELIKVDGDLYMSCATEAIDADYLNAIIAEATAAVKEKGLYVFNMVGLRKLALEEGNSTARLLNTLRLNTYEMSVLVHYMEQFPQMSIDYTVVDGKQSIVFDVRH